MTPREPWSPSMPLRADATDHAIIERLRKAMIAPSAVEGLRPPANYFECAAVVVAREFADARVAAKDAEIAQLEAERDGLYADLSAKVSARDMRIQELEARLAASSSAPHSEPIDLRCAHCGLPNFNHSNARARECLEALSNVAASGTASSAESVSLRRRAMQLVDALSDWRSYWETEYADDLVLTGKQADELCVMLNVPFGGQHASPPRETPIGETK